jgi:hypothetical protein
MGWGAQPALLSDYIPSSALHGFVRHLGHIAIQPGRKLKWDPDKEIFPGDDEANRYIANPIHKPHIA